MSAAASRRLKLQSVCYLLIEFLSKSSSGLQAHCAPCWYLCFRVFHTFRDAPVMLKILVFRNVIHSRSRMKSRALCPRRSLRARAAASAPASAALPCCFPKTLTRAGLRMRSFPVVHCSFFGSVTCEDFGFTSSARKPVRSRIT